MIDLEEYADDHCLELVTTTEGTNGYPKNLKKVVTGFDTFEDALQCAREIEGEVCLISKRDGHQFWVNNGRTYEPIEINEKWFSDNDVVIRGIPASDWWKDEFQMLKDTLLTEDDDCPSPKELIEIIQTFQTYSKLYDMIESLDENQQIYYEKGFPQNAEIVPICTMRYHDFDVHEYAIAVTMDLSEPDYRESEENA